MHTCRLHEGFKDLNNECYSVRNGKRIYDYDDIYPVAEPREDMGWPWPTH